MSSNVFQVVQAFLRDSGIAHVFLGFLWKMLEDVLEDVEMSNAFPGRRDIYKIRIIIKRIFKVAQRLPGIITTKANICWDVFQCLPGFACLFARFWDC